MRKLIATLGAGLIGLIVASHAVADLPGQWRTEFDSPVGLQKYLYTFQSGPDGKLSGKASADIGGRTRESELKEIKVNGDAISFVELTSFQGTELRIEYTGKLTANDMKLTRK